MNNNKTTKRALCTSIVALLICFTMLIGTTYAWFTDSVTSSGNKIQSGTLDVQLTWTDDAAAAEDTWNDVEADNADPIFDYELWEPGYTAVRYLKVKNNGTLALKYKVQIITNGSLAQNGVKLSDVIDVYYAPSKVDVPDRDLDNNTNLTKLGTLTQFLTGGAVINDELLATESDYATLVLQMQESAGNEYQGLTVGTSFDIMLFAAQLTYEEDSFDETYDEDAIFEGTASETVVPGEVTEIVILAADGRTKIGTVLVPADAVADGVTEITATVNESSYTPNINVAAGSEQVTVDITVSGLKEGNTAPVKTQYYIGKGYDPATVTVYHYDEPIAAGDEAYNPTTGYVIFETTGYSPFTFVYDKDSVVTIPDVDGTNDLPGLNLVYAPQYVIGGEEADIEWENYGSWSPTDGLEAHLETAYIFESTDSAEDVEASPYRTWICDFYVKVTTADGSNPFVNEDGSNNYIFLGGNYGDFGWVGFHFTDSEYVSGTEIPLLQSVAGGWTYEQIADLVGIFTCGVGDHENGLSGATFTVSLRLVNPDNSAEYYDVAVVSYDFN